MTINLNGWLLTDTYSRFSGAYLPCVPVAGFFSGEKRPRTLAPAPWIFPDNHVAYGMILLPAEGTASSFGLFNQIEAQPE
jgi:hypothetical protein